MEVILIKKLKRKGQLGDRVKVSDGFARNFLFPNNYALPVTPENLRRFESIKKKEIEHLAKEKIRFEEVKAKVDGKEIQFKAKTHKGQLYGSITPNDVLKELHKKFEVAVERDMISMPAHIKQTGKFTVELNFHPEVSATLKLKVTSQSEVEDPTSYEEAIEMASKKAEEGKETAEKQKRKPRAKKAAEE